MHKEILSKEQVELLPLLKAFSSDYYLVGGTAIALYLGHRRSIDFDLFTFKNIGRLKIKNKIEKVWGKVHTIINANTDEYTIVLNDVKLTFYNFPYNIPHNKWFEKIITVPDLIDLAAMKAFSLSRRAKWKDYIDFYFILKDSFNLHEIAERTNELFPELFSERLFLQQLSFFADVNYGEMIEYMGDGVKDDIVKEYLTKITLVEFDENVNL